MGYACPRFTAEIYQSHEDPKKELVLHKHHLPLAKTPGETPDASLSINSGVVMNVKYGYYKYIYKKEYIFIYNI